jgi:uncharacterized membrane protein (DUF485 family)
MDQNTINGLIVGSIVSYLLPKASPYIDKLIRRCFAILLNTLLKPLKGYFRKKRLRKLREFRAIRKNDSAVTMQVVRAYAYFLLFWGVIAFYINLLTQTAFPAILDKSFVFGMFLTTPIYIVEMVWLSAASKAKELVKNRGKLGL